MENNKQQTALQQFIEKICYFDYILQKWSIRTIIEDEDITLYVEEFKELEKQQIMDAWCDGNDSEGFKNKSKQYYKETFE